MTSRRSIGVLASKINSPLTRDPQDRRFVRAAYVDLAGRSPLLAEQTESEGKTRGEFLHQLGHSDKFFDGFYERELFYFLLIDQFRPSTKAFEKIPGALSVGSMSVKECLRSLVSSQFFNQRNPGNDTFVTVVLEQLLGVTVQKEIPTLEAGKKMYDGREIKFLGQRGNSQADLVRIALDDKRFETAFLSRQYQQFLGRELPSKVAAQQAKRLRAEPHSFADLVVEWLSSQDYQELTEVLRPKNDQVFIQSLFVDLLGRTPEYQESRRCRNALLALSDSRPLRSVVIKLMLDSGSFGLLDPQEQSAAARVRALFLHFLCREPTASELSLFVDELNRGAQAKTLLRAILTHWEYHHY